MKTLLILACVLVSVIASNISEDGVIDEKGVTNGADKDIKNHEQVNPVIVTTESNGQPINHKNVTGQHNSRRTPTRVRTHRNRNHRHRQSKPRRPARRHHAGRKDNQHRRTHRNKRLH